MKNGTWKKVALVLFISGFNAQASNEETIRLKLSIKTANIRANPTVIQNLGDLAIVSEKDASGKGYELQVTSTRPLQEDSDPSNAIEISMKRMSAVSVEFV
ncbi:hypothetical protein GW915_09500 [bacterium]|nr:hypothetical protein [bacterium]